MSKTVIAGFDAGTSKFRCLLFDLNGNEKFSTSLKTPLKKNHDGYFYNSAEEIFNISIKIFRKASQFANKNNLPFAEGNAIKYICRHSAKNGKEDLEKAKHYIDMIIERDYS